MRCLSCHKPLNGNQAKLWRRKLLCCTGCHGLAEKAEAELKAAARRAEEQSMIWLEQHILGGGLLRGVSGAGVHVQRSSEVSELRAPQGDTGSSEGGSSEAGLDPTEHVPTREG